MLTKKLFAFITAGLIVCCGAIADAPQPQITVPCKIVSIHDGDTVVVDVTIRMSVRLIDCWAPELTGAESEQGLASKATLESLIEDKSGLLSVPIGKNLGQSISLSRVLGRLNVDGKDVSTEMVAAGAATATKKKK